VAERVRRFEERTGRVPTIFVTDREEFLGELPGTALSVADPETERITDHLRETPSVRYDRADEEVLAVFPSEQRADRRGARRGRRHPRCDSRERPPATDRRSRRGDAL